MSKGKLVKWALTAAMALATCRGWLASINMTQASIRELDEWTQSGDLSVSDGLYGQAVEQYKVAISEGLGLEGYEKLLTAYDLYYSDEPTNEVRNAFISDMLEAASLYPKQTEFWEKACQLYLEDGSMRNAYSVVKSALNRGATSDYLKEVEQSLWYSTHVDYKLYYDVKNPLGAYIVASDGDSVALLDQNGKSIRDGYPMIGVPSEDGYALYVYGNETRLLDAKGIARARVPFVVEDAGCWDYESCLVPVLIDGTWDYLDTSTRELRGASYAQAGAYAGGIAAVQEKDGVWHVIDTSGAVVSNDFEDFRLDPFGRCFINGLAIAKIQGSWRLYDVDFNVIGDFSCDDIDMPTQDGIIAFMRDAKWGYVNSAGEVVVEPTYECARSFSCGLAAIRINAQQWGFIDENYRIVIEPQFLNAYYFNNAGKALVSLSEGSCQFLGFNFR